MEIGQRVLSFAAAEEGIRKKRSAGQMLAPITTFDAARNSLLRWIIDANVPFTVVKHHALRELLSLLNCEMTAQLVPEGGSTIRRWIAARYEV